MQVLAAMKVAARPPRLFFSETLPAGHDWAPLKANVGSGYEAPAVIFSGPDDLMVAGRSFNVVSASGGVVRDSVHLTDRFRLKDFFEGIEHTRRMDDADKAMLVAGNIFAHNYFHWTTQCLPAVLLYRAALKSTGGALATPGLLPMMVETLRLHGVEMEVMQVEPNVMAVIAGGYHTNLMGSHYSHAPHPQIVRLLREPLGRITPGRAFGRRLYITRRDSGKRRMTNEAAVEARLRARGFEVLELAGLSVADQMVAFRDAEAIVAPHGAGLTNLLYCDVARAPAVVVELVQSNFINMCFMRIGQLLGLRHSVIVNPVDPAPEEVLCGRPDDTTWRADLALIDRVLDENGL